ncbi:MAG: tRNA1(Val) (adenine(37)-N6)-methyltransferase [Lachnospiraceae bacterium]|nr:tRNA1(Val) (adenine(37)-N6)-methyltransferase [Lachnospiraceae bacterium]
MDLSKWKKEGERIDSVDRDDLYIIQNPSKFCFGMDAVLLSSFAKAKKNEDLIDLCTGNGILPILLYAKTQAKSIRGLEIQEDIAEMADRSIRMNEIEDRVKIVTGDVKDASKIFGASSFNVVTCNPPYMIENHGIKNPSDAKYIARHEALCTLEDIVYQTSRLLKMNGRCYFVHRPFRLVDLFYEMRKNKIEPKRMRLVHPYKDREPNMVLVEGVKGGNSRLTIEKPLVVYKDKNVYTDEIISIYRD